ncbi:MAG: CoA transferase subunit A [Deltaproteobacteria bacterium]|nr:CoA transferase subunit A [Deltaproteobacteria bacterium]
MKRPSRQSKVLPIAEAVRQFVRPGALVAVGGMHMHNNPMALIREVIRQRIPIGTLMTGGAGGLNADLLIGAGLVAEVLTCYVGFEYLGLAPRFRQGVEAGGLRVREVDEAFVLLALRAGAHGSPFMPYPAGMGVQEFARVNPRDYQRVTDPFTGEQVWAARAAVPDVALVHAQLVDPFGNAAFLGSLFADREMILAARHTVLQADAVVSPLAVRRAGGTGLPGFLFAAVVEAPYGCHPTSSHGRYLHDEAHLQAYLGLKGQEEFEAYLKVHVLDPEGPAAYARSVGGRRHLASLREAGRRRR